MFISDTSLSSAKKIKHQRLLEGLAWRGLPLGNWDTFRAISAFQFTWRRKSTIPVSFRWQRMFSKPCRWPNGVPEDCGRCREPSNDGSSDLAYGRSYSKRGNQKLHPRPGHDRGVKVELGRTCCKTGTGQMDAHGERGEAVDDPKSVGLTMTRHGKTLERSTSRSGWQMAEEKAECCREPANSGQLGRTLK